jgi:hypothetical protein
LVVKTTVLIFDSFVYRVFGYGSLINQESLSETLQKHVFCSPAVLPGYKRLFESNCWQRRSANNTPVSALNIRECDDCYVNGVVFDVDEEQYELLKRRECNYKTIQATVSDWHTKQSFEVVTFMDEPSGIFDFVRGDPEQHDYLTICISGAKKYGDQFLQNFVDSTFINDQTLSEYLKENNYLIK